MDLYEKNKIEAAQYLKELKDYNFGTDIKIKYFSDLKDGEHPGIAKWFMQQLTALYMDGILTRKPTEVEAFVKCYDDGSDPKLVVNYTLSLS